MTSTDLVRVFISDESRLGVEVSWIIITLVIVLPIIGMILRRYMPRWRKHFRVVELEIELGGVGKVKLKPIAEDIQIAHQIWTELATRKAALVIDPDHDVIVEVYNSWYVLFGRVRELIAGIPAELIRGEESTKVLVRVATDTLNDGLRPHLTQWQARFRNWYAQQGDELKTRHPQDVQRDFPQYDELIADMLRVNLLMIQYASELKKLVQTG